MYKGLRVAVVVPAYNEEDNLQQTLATIPAYVDHVLVVDDGSADQTSTVAAEHVRPGIEVLRHLRNLRMSVILLAFRRLTSQQPKIAFLRGNRLL